MGSIGNLDAVGVAAVFEGFAEYLQKVGAFNRANETMGVSAKKAAADHNVLGAAADNLKQKFGGLVQAAVALGVGFASFQTIKSAISFTVQYAQEIRKLTRELGISSEAAGAIVVQVGKFGLSASDISRGLGILAKQLKGVSDAETGVTTGTLKASDLLKSMGINAVDAHGNIMPMEELLPKIADAFQRMPDGINKTGFAMQLFGRSGKTMIPFLNEGAAGLAKAREEMRKYGLELSGESVQKIIDFTFAQDELSHAVEGFKLTVGMALIPELTKLIKWLTDLQPQAVAFANTFSTDVPVAIEETVASIKDMVRWGGEIVGMFHAASDSENQLLAGAGAMAVAFAFLNPTGAIIAGVLAITLGIHEFNKEVDGSDEAALHFQKVYLQALLAIIEGIIDAEKAIAGFFGKGALGLVGIGIGAAASAAVGFSDKGKFIDAGKKAGEGAGDALGRGFVEKTTGLNQYADALRAKIATIGDVQVSSKFERSIQSEEDALRRARGQITGAGEDLAGFGDASGSAASAVDQLAAAVAAAKKSFDSIDEVSSGLQLQIDLLMQQKAALEASGQSTEGVDAKLAALNNRLSQHKNFATFAKDAVDALSTALLAAGMPAKSLDGSVVDVATAVDGLQGALNSLPEEQQIEVLAKLPLDDMAAILTFLNVLAQGVTVPIALAIAQQASDLNKQPASFAKIKQQEGLASATGTPMEIITAGSKVLKDVSANVDNFAKSTKGAGGAADKANDDLLALAKAFEAWHAVTGGSLEDFRVLLKLESDRLALDQRVADAQINLRVAMQENNDASYQLKLTYVALADEAIRSGHTIEQVTTEMFDKIAQSALDATQGALSKLFGTPTKEDLQLQLRLQKAQLNLDRIQSANPNNKQAIKAAEAQVKSAQNLINRRREELDILKTETELKDKTLLTDAQRLAQIQQLARAEEQQSQQVADLNGQLYLQTIASMRVADAANAEADALARASGATGGSTAEGLIAAYKAYNGGVGPALAGGGVVMGPTTVFMGEGGRRELVVPLEDPRAKQLLAAMPNLGFAGATNYNTFAPSLTTQGNDERSIRGLFEGWLETFLRQSRGRASRAGAPLTASIG